MCNCLRNNREACVKTRLALNLRRYGATRAQGGREPALGAHDVRASRGTAHRGAGTRSEKHAPFFSRSLDREARRVHRGRGIAIFPHRGRGGEATAKQRRDDAFVAQAYLANPLLVRGRKFDVRVFALVAPDGGAYVYGDGYVRTCTTPHTVEDLADLSAHLTNDAVQRSLKGYGKHEDCNKLSPRRVSARSGRRASGSVRSRTDRGGSIPRTTCGPRSSASPRALGATLGCGTPRDGGDHDARRSRNPPSRARRSRCSV